MKSASDEKHLELVQYSIMITQVFGTQTEVVRAELKRSQLPYTPSIAFRITVYSSLYMKLLKGKNRLPGRLQMVLC